MGTAWLERFELSGFHAQACAGGTGEVDFFRVVKFQAISHSRAECARLPPL
jgi:hypothetical protein